MTATPLISMRHLRKTYVGVVALDDMSIEVMPGSIHAILGENGAGKSTLMKVLAGIVTPDSGQMQFAGAPLVLSGPQAARRLGIGLVHQELSLFPERSVLANLFVNAEPLRGGFVSLSAMRRISAPILARLGLDVDPLAPVGRLSIAERQLVELARVLLERPRLLILDEPNSALGQRETDRLFAVLRDLRGQGITQLYVSHRLEEVFVIADTITVTRNGRNVLTAPTAALSMGQVIEAMIGQAPSDHYPPRRAVAATGGAALQVMGLTGGQLAATTLTAAPGQVVGLAGLDGSGSADLLALLFGLRRPAAGRAQYPDGRSLPSNPTRAARRGICLVPADRRNQGLMLDRSILFNMSTVAEGASGTGLAWFRVGRALDRARRQIAALGIRTASPLAAVQSLSGGNQQKVAIGKWLEVAPKLFLLDDPTRGVDVGAKAEIYTLIRRLADDGGIVLFRSTELPELAGLCDRILIFHRGRLTAEVPGPQADAALLSRLINTGAPLQEAMA